MTSGLEAIRVSATAKPGRYASILALVAIVLACLAAGIAFAPPLEQGTPKLGHEWLIGL